MAQKGRCNGLLPRNVQIPPELLRFRNIQILPSEYQNCTLSGLVFHPDRNYSLHFFQVLIYLMKKRYLEDTSMPRYAVALTDNEIQELKALIQKGGKGYRIKHAQILLKLNRRPENADWTYDRIQKAYGATHNTIAGVAKRFVTEGLEAALERKKQQNRYRKVTGDIEAKICMIACSGAPEGHSRWTMQAIADELVRLEIVDSITDSTVCNVMKKMKSGHGL